MACGQALPDHKPVHQQTASLELNLDTNGLVPLLAHACGPLLPLPRPTPRRCICLRPSSRARSARRPLLHCHQRKRRRRSGFPASWACSSCPHSQPKNTPVCDTCHLYMSTVTPPYTVSSYSSSRLGIVSVTLQGARRADESVKRPRDIRIVLRGSEIERSLKPVAGDRTGNTTGPATPATKMAICIRLSFKGRGRLHMVHHFGLRAAGILGNVEGEETVQSWQPPPPSSSRHSTCPASVPRSG